MTIQPLKVSSQEALEAVRARIRGEWDNPALVKFGSLSTDTMKDILYIVDKRNHAPVGSRIKTSFVNPPIPIRDFDWVAWIDGEEEGHRGHGKQEQDAIHELLCLLAQYDGEVHS